MIVGIIGSLIASVIAALVVFVYRRGYLHGLVNEVLFHIGPSRVHEQALLPRETTALQARLVRCLLRDQSRFGRHRGQYGKSCDAVQSRRWQTKGSGENMNLKPRMYLTYWPVSVLHSHNLVPKSERLAISGVASLFVDGGIPLFTSEPDSSPTRREQKWNHRHTMAGAHLLAIATPDSGITRSVVGQMLDQRNAWQDASGGWWQTSERKNSPDLWASVYALKLLDYVSSHDIPGFRDKATLLKSAMERTYSYLDAEWEATRWGEPGRLLPEENLVSLFIDLGSIGI